jgi:hypothetical protein
MSKSACTYGWHAVDPACQLNRSFLGRFLCVRVCGLWCRYHPPVADGRMCGSIRQYNSWPGIRSAMGGVETWGAKLTQATHQAYTSGRDLQIFPMRSLQRTEAWMLPTNEWGTRAMYPAANQRLSSQDVLLHLWFIGMSGSQCITLMSMDNTNNT